MLSALLLLLACIGAIGEMFTDSTGLRLCELIGLIGFILIEFRQMARMAQALVMICVVLVGYEAFTGRFDTELVAAGLDRAAFFALFLASLSFLQFAAGRSPLIIRSGEILVRQPPGRRYSVLTFGAAFLAILLNFSTIGLLGTMITKGIAPGTTPEEIRIAKIRRRRMTLAMLRGFCALPLWSPFTVTMALITAVLPGVRYIDIALFSAPLAIVTLVIGWIIDRFSFPRTSPANLPQPPSLTGLLPLMGLVISVPAIFVAVSRLLDIGLVQGLLLCLPFVSFGWLMLQQLATGFGPAAHQTARDMAGGLLPSWPGMRSEIALFACSAFLGVMILPLIDTQALGTHIVSLGLSSGVVLALSAWIAFLVSLIGVSPIISITLLAGTLPHLSGLDISPVTVGVTMVAIWSAVVNVTPYSASVRLSARMINEDPIKVGIQWNALYGVITMTIMSVGLLIWG